MCDRMSAKALKEHGECYQCKLWRTRPEYRARWSRTSSVCPFLGPQVLKDGVLLTTRCGPCKGNVQRKVFNCLHPSREPDEVTVRDDCGKCLYAPRQGTENLVLKLDLSPGDVTVLTAVIYSLHKQYPVKYKTAVQTFSPAIWEHNPDVVPLETMKNPRLLDMKYSVKRDFEPAINQSNDRSIHFMDACCEYLEGLLKVPVPLLTNRPRLYLSSRERSWLPQVPGKFWLINSGVKSDLTAKQYPHYQEVVNRLKGKVRFVQVGKEEHGLPLEGALNLLDKTNPRQLIRLVSHCEGVVCGTTWLMHLAAAFEKPSVILAGGREPRSWNQYPLSHVISTIGSLPCCLKRSCWRSRVRALGDGREQDASLCERPVGEAPECLAAVPPQEVAEAIARYASSLPPSDEG